MIAVYLPGRTWMHALPARLKLLMLAIGSIVLFPVSEPVLLAFFLTGVLALVLSLGRSALTALGRLTALLPVLGVLLLFHFVLGTFESGLVAVLRLSTLLILAYLVSLTTRMDAMIDALAPLLIPLSWIGLSERRLAMAIALVLRFTPVLAALGLQLGAAYRARTGRSGRFKLVAPLCLQALNAADHVADAIAARGGIDPSAAKTSSGKVPEK